MGRQPDRRGRRRHALRALMQSVPPVRLLCPAGSFLLHWGRFSTRPAKPSRRDRLVLIKRGLAPAPMRSAMNIPGFGGMPIGSVLTASARNFFRDDMATYASALAYQILFSLFPLFIFLLALVGTLHLPDFMPWLLEQ